MIGLDETICISIGGSTIYPENGLNAEFLKKFNQFIRKQIAETKRRFFIIVSDGQIGSEYQYAGRLVVGQMQAEDLNWLGVHGTRMNAHLLRTIFRDVAYKRVISNYQKIPDVGVSRVIVCAGGQPGRSTDSDMTILARKMSIKQAVCLVNVIKVYEKDPALFPKARAFDQLTWHQYRELIGDWWDPLRRLPFDPFAAKTAEDSGLAVYFVYGGNFENFERLLTGKPFDGTVISNNSV